MKKYLRSISKVVLRYILLCLFSLVGKEHHAQVPSGVLNESERGYFVTLTGLIEYLKQQPTLNSVTHKPGSKKGNAPFYDQVIERFFDRKAILEEFESDTIVHGVKRRFDALLHTLHDFDRGLDTVQPSSILIEPFRFPFQVNKDREVQNALKIRIGKGYQKNQVLTFFFDDKTNKIVGIATSYE